jgi:hypothetical protein
MTIEKLIEEVKKSNDVVLDILIKKGNDYTNKCVFDNFNQIHEIIKILNIDFNKKESVFIFYTLIKLQRLCNLIFNNKEVKNESLTDTILDFKNYLTLLENFIKENPSKWGIL